MDETFSVVDDQALSDLTVYLQRAARVEDGAVRMIAGSGVLAVYSAVLYPRGLLDRTPTVLGLRTFATDREASFDSVVPLRSLSDRLARAAASVAAESEPHTIELRMPMEVSTVTWAGISPPRAGWRQVGTTEVAALDAAARAGIDEVAQTIPEGTGEQLVQAVRAEVWGRPIETLEYVPAGAAFAASSLGFLADEQPITVYETGPWTRLTTRYGHVLVRRQSWTLRA